MNLRKCWLLCMSLQCHSQFFIDTSNVVVLLSLTFTFFFTQHFKYIFANGASQGANLNDKYCSLFVKRLIIASFARWLKVVENVESEPTVIPYHIIKLAMKFGNFFCSLSRARIFLFLPPVFGCFYMDSSIVMRQR